MESSHGFLILMVQQMLSHLLQANGTTLMKMGLAIIGLIFLGMKPERIGQLAYGMIMQQSLMHARS